MQRSQTQALQHRLHLLPISICGQAFLGLISHGTHLRKSCFRTVSHHAYILWSCTHPHLCVSVSQRLVGASCSSEGMTLCVRHRPGHFERCKDLLRCSLQVVMQESENPAAIIVWHSHHAEMTTLLTLYISC